MASALGLDVQPWARTSKRQDTAEQRDPRCAGHVVLLQQLLTPLVPVEAILAAATNDPKFRWFNPRSTISHSHSCHTHICKKPSAQGFGSIS